LALGPGGLLAVIDSAAECVILLDDRFRVLRRLCDERSHPVGVAFSRDGQRLLVLHAEPPSVVVFDTQGAYIHSWGERGSGAGQFSSPGGIAAGRDGFVYVSDRAAHRIQKFDEKGDFVTQWGSHGIGASEFFKPRDVAQDARGRVVGAKQ
jgi:DNA-binding beta-propeller fold protein YncE